MLSYQRFVRSIAAIQQCYWKRGTSHTVSRQSSYSARQAISTNEFDYIRRTSCIGQGMVARQTCQILPALATFRHRWPRVGPALISRSLTKQIAAVARNHWQDQRAGPRVRSGSGANVGNENGKFQAVGTPTDYSRRMGTADVVLLTMSVACGWRSKKGVRELWCWDRCLPRTRSPRRHSFWIKAL